jgi:2-polyprenyl-3-methyl-5-hydroxy-6-metoxy-1,4-benzoquinol methylase
MTQDKTNRDFWEGSWRDIPFGGYSGWEKHLAINRKLDRLFRKYLPGRGKNILEIGCAGGKRLIRLAQILHARVSGLDYSAKGVALARENLKAAGVEGDIRCEDLFATSFKTRSFDAVYSLGLIEHFNNPEGAIESHLNLLKNGGILVITVPNFNDSLTGLLNRMAGRAAEIAATHNLAVLNKAALCKLLEKQGVKIIKAGFFGPVDFSTAFSGWRFKPLLYLMHLLNQMAGYLTYWLPANGFLAPYLIIVAEKAERTA